MRNFGIGLIALLGFLCLLSCEKDVNELNDITPLETRSSYEECIILGEDIRQERGVLHFESVEQIQMIYECLEKNHAEYLEQSYGRYDSLCDDEFDELEESGEILIDDHAVLRSFERALNFRSLRGTIEKQELEWLLQEELDDENDPDDHFVIDEVFRTLLSPEASVIIAGEMHQFNDEALAAEEEEEGYESIHPNIDCRSMKSKTYIKYSDKKRIKCVVAHRTYPWGRYAIAKTKNYKKRRWIGWKKYRTFTIAQVHGYIADSAGDCKTPTNFNPSGSYWWGNKKSRTHRIEVSTKTNSGWVKGNHIGAAGNKATILTW